MVGNWIAIALIIFKMITGKAVERHGFLVMQGAFVGVVLNNVDVLNHYLFGLDDSLGSDAYAGLCGDDGDDGRAAV